ncbi:MAG TPA: ABC transporter ATP-binding protein, partial [Tenericutes bacterium]|nr:ABC transporter ATP-binding protein [Mycoplasmatota bacterium]
MIRLNNVSKFYYNKGIITSGFSKVNLELNIGEFVSIVGESGSGKSTLLNVISGLDSYEEGEMYINGEETSHYSEKDFEDYRRKYIGNIFQNFNLVNSYTVYQNIELVLLLNGFKKRQIKKKVYDLIKKVDLYKYKNTKVSKLSGGQKQRVAIARALAKDTPIIIADEPTGNLDSASAAGIVKLLSELAKDKLVIIVTHNYEQIMPYVTRTIKMHDGKILEDKNNKEITVVKDIDIIDYESITFFNKLRLGIRNSVNIVPKFLLLLFVFLFIIVSLTSEYSSYKKQEYLYNKMGYNHYFINNDDKRIVIKKENNQTFEDNDYKKIETLTNIDKIVKNDLLLDFVINLSDEKNFWMNGLVSDTGQLTTVDVGRMPVGENEIVIEGNKNDYYISNMKNHLDENEIYLQNYYTGFADKNIKLKIVGINYSEYSGNNYNYHKVYMSDSILRKINYQIHQQNNKVRTLFENVYYNSEPYTNYFKLIPNSNVPKGQVFITSDLNYNCNKQNCINKTIDVEVSNIYYSDKITLTISKTYDKNNFKKLIGENDYDNYNYGLFVNPDDYNSLYNKDNYQSSVFVKNIDKIDKTITELNNFGFKTLAIKDALAQDGANEIIKIFKTIITIVLVITLFFISYFVIKLIMKS